MREQGRTAILVLVRTFLMGVEHPRGRHGETWEYLHSHAHITVYSWLLVLSYHSLIWWLLSNAKFRYLFLNLLRYKGMPLLTTFILIKPCCVSNLRHASFRTGLSLLLFAVHGLASACGERTFFWGFHLPLNNCYRFFNFFLRNMLGSSQEWVWRIFFGKWFFYFCIANLLHIVGHGLRGTYVIDTLGRLNEYLRWLLFRSLLHWESFPYYCGLFRYHC